MEAKLERLNYNSHLFLFKVGSLTLYEWTIENAVQWGRKTRKYSAVNVEPCGLMMVNIEKRYKYTWHMDIESAVECLEKAGIDTTEFIETAKEFGWIIP